MNRTVGVTLACLSYHVYIVRVMNLTPVGGIMPGTSLYAYLPVTGGWL